MKLNRYWIAPMVFGTLVVVLGLGLLVIGAHSPYTHSNRNPGPSAVYNRTQQTLVGTPVPYVPPGPKYDVAACGLKKVLTPSACYTPSKSTQPASASDEVTRGSQLFVEEMCASCHGLNGRGGVFAPSIRGFTAKQLQQKTEQGPGGMPAFAGLSQAQLQAIAAFLNSGNTARAAAAR